MHDNSCLVYRVLLKASVRQLEFVLNVAGVDSYNSLTALYRHYATVGRVISTARQYCQTGDEAGFHELLADLIALESRREAVTNFAGDTDKLHEERRISESRYADFLMSTEAKRLLLQEQISSLQESIEASERLLRTRVEYSNRRRAAIDEVRRQESYMLHAKRTPQDIYKRDETLCDISTQTDEADDQAERIVRDIKHAAKKFHLDADLKALREHIQQEETTLSNIVIL